MNINKNINDLINYRINRAKETIGEVEDLLKLEYFNTAVNRIYYACYYAISGLLLKKGLSAKSHDGVRQMFGLHYVKTNIVSKDLAKYFTDLFDRRQTGDYDDFVVYQKEIVEELYKTGKVFINAIEELIHSIT
jgi:uncharacterized protein (UPF0332 family)